MFTKYIFHKNQKFAPQMGVKKIISKSENENFEILFELGIIGTELNFWIQINVQNRKILIFEWVRSKKTIFEYYNEKRQFLSTIMKFIQR